MHNSYKDQFNEWYAVFEEDNQREPTLNECTSYQNDWIESKYDLADQYRKISKGE